MEPCEPGEHSFDPWRSATAEEQNKLRHPNAATIELHKCADCGEIEISATYNDPYGQLPTEFKDEDGQLIEPTKNGTARLDGEFPETCPVCNHPISIIDPLAKAHDHFAVCPSCLTTTTIRYAPYEMTWEPANKK